MHQVVCNNTHEKEEETTLLHLFMFAAAGESHPWKVESPLLIMTILPAFLL